MYVYVYTYVSRCPRTRGIRLTPGKCMYIEVRIGGLQCPSHFTSSLRFLGFRVRCRRRTACRHMLSRTPGVRGFEWLDQVFLTYCARWTSQFRQHTLTGDKLLFDIKYSVDSSSLPSVAHVPSRRLSVTAGVCVSCPHVGSTTHEPK